MSDQQKSMSDIVQLETPIGRGEQSIAELRVRKPASGELRGLNLHDILKLDVDTMHEMLPRITMPPITKDEAMKLDPADLVSLSAEVADFFVPRGLRPESQSR